MKLTVHLDEGDKETPIEMANAIIRNYVDRMYVQTEDDLDEAYCNLAEIAEHIQTYVKYNRKPSIIFLDGRA